jgi:hypothetical protein
LAKRELHSCDSRDALRRNCSRLDLLRVKAAKDKLFDLVADLDIDGEPSG